MAHYEARVTETVEYRVFVEAADDAEAVTMAEELIVDADDPNDYFFGVIDRTVADIRELD